MHSASHYILQVNDLWLDGHSSTASLWKVALQSFSLFLWLGGFCIFKTFLLLDFSPMLPGKAEMVQSVANHQH